jgi:hypothetical protein
MPSRTAIRVVGDLLDLLRKFFVRVHVRADGQEHDRHGGCDDGEADHPPNAMSGGLVVGQEQHSDEREGEEAEDGAHEYG